MGTESEYEPTSRSGWSRSCYTSAGQTARGRVSAGPAEPVEKQEGARGTENTALKHHSEDPRWRGLPHVPNWKSGPPPIK